MAKVLEMAGRNLPAASRRPRLRPAREWRRGRHQRRASRAIRVARLDESDAGAVARLDRYIGYDEPCATSNESLVRDRAVQEEARATSYAEADMRAERLQSVEAKVTGPQPK